MHAHTRSCCRQQQSPRPIRPSTASKLLNLSRFLRKGFKPTYTEQTLPNSATSHDNLNTQSARPSQVQIAVTVGLPFSLAMRPQGPSSAGRLPQDQSGVRCMICSTPKPTPLSKYPKPALCQNALHDRRRSCGFLTGSAPFDELLPGMEQASDHNDAWPVHSL